MINLKIWNKDNNYFSLESRDFIRQKNLWYRGHQLNGFIQIIFLIIKVYAYLVFVFFVYFHFAKWVERMVFMILSLWYFYFTVIIDLAFLYWVYDLNVSCPSEFDVTCQIWSRFDSLFLKLWNLFQSLRIP